MPTRIRTVPGALAILCAVVALCLVPQAASATVTAKLRVLTPDQVLDPGTTYIVDDDVTVPTRPDADCFGPPGGTGAEFSYEKPNALTLLATAGRTTKSVAPLSLTDQFGFGLGVCGIGGVEATDTSFWYLKSNHEEATVGADQLEIHDGDEILYYLSPNNYPDPNPAELELQAPARAQAGQPFSVTVLEHKCVTDPDTFVTTCDTGPAAGVTVDRRRRAGDHRRRRHGPAHGRLAQRGRARRHPRSRHPVRGAADLRRRHARRLPEGARRVTGRQPAARQDQRHQGRRLRSARAAATTASMPARAAPT